MTLPINVSQRIKAFNESLLPDKVQLKYKLMAASAYRFYRGTCHLFYEDLSKYPSFPASPLVWACGDLYLENFGSYKAKTGLFNLIRMILGSAIADELIEPGKSCGWQSKILAYAVQYAKQVQADYQAFVQDYNKGNFK